MFRSLLRWPKASLRAYFMAVIVVATVPIGALAAYLIAQQILDGRQQIEAGLLRSANNFALTVERELVSSIDALYILSYSPTLQQDDISGFFGTLNALPTLRSSWSSVYLVDLQGQMVFNLRQTPGEPLGKLQDTDALARLKRTRQPVLTDLTLNARGAYTTGVLVPVDVKGEVRYALGAWIDATNWQRLMSSASIESNGFLALFDARNRLIARSRDGALFVGRKMPDAVAQVVSTQSSGLTTAKSLAGNATYMAVQRIGIGGWGVSVGLAADPINRAHAWSFAAALMAGLTSLLAGLALAWLVSRRVTTPLQAMAQQGPDAVQARSEVLELAWLQEALHVAQAQRETARERLQAKADEFETLFGVVSENGK